jgi:hypothetical protein
MRAFKSFRIKLPSGERYWTVVDDSYRSVQGVDDWLLHLRIGRGCAESTTESYAGALALFFEWCASSTDGNPLRPRTSTSPANPGSEHVRGGARTAHGTASSARLPTASDACSRG